MPNGERQARLERAKAIGRIGYRIVRAANLMDVREIEGEERHLREFRRGSLFIDLFEPSRLVAGAESSQLRIAYDGKEVLEVRWDSTDAFNVVLFEEAVEWIGSLARAMPRLT
jgi:hypothetical protein